MKNLLPFERWKLYEEKEIFYEVEKGDTLGKISKKLGLGNWKDIYDLNKDVIGKNPNNIRTGMKLKVPGQISDDKSSNEIPSDFNPSKYLLMTKFDYTTLPSYSDNLSKEIYKPVDTKYYGDSKDLSNTKKSGGIGTIFGKAAMNIGKKLSNLKPPISSPKETKNKESTSYLNRYSKFEKDSIQNSILLKDFSDGPYSWKNGSTGMPVDIYFKSETPIFKKPGDGTTYCTGYTFAAAFITALNRGLFKDFTDSDIKQMQKIWNIGNAKDHPKLCVDAISKPISKNLKALGKEIDLNSVKSGDFCQIWRTNGSGHSVVIIDKIKSKGKIVGLKYYSSNQTINPETDKSGPGERIEYFSDSGGKVLRDKTYYARLNRI